MRKLWFITPILSVVLVISMGGCAGKDPNVAQPKPGKAVSVSQKSAAGQQGLVEKEKLGTWQGDIPSYPLKGSENTREGAATVAAFWVSALNYAMFTGDTKPLEAATGPEQPAFKMVKRLQEHYKEKGRYFGKPLTFSLEQQELVDEKTFDTQFHIKESAYTLERGENIPAAEGVAKIRTTYTGSKWIVVNSNSEEMSEK
ncbi:MAG: DUF6318 family protein [Actinomycetaceae bacterium]|nr:DUF6318 family protein [Actinomycetaceae bacterium]